MAVETTEPAGESGTPGAGGAAAVPAMAELLDGSPTNWGRWGENDEVGSLNHLTAADVLAAVRLVRSGRVFTLQIPIGHPHGDPVWPRRRPAERYTILDEADWEAGRHDEVPGGMRYADDVLNTYLQGSTHYDALGHAWFDGRLWNGYEAGSTVGGLGRASVAAIADRGVVGRGVLVDLARFRGRAALEKGETFTHRDVQAAAAEQGVEIRRHDVLLLRTGFLGGWYRTTAARFYADFAEPGLVHSPELVRWFADLEIPNLVTDTMANEVTRDPASGAAMVLHCALMRNLGVTFTEMARLDALAEDCAEDGQWDFLYVAAPLHVVAGTGAPVNPVVIK